MNSALLKSAFSQMMMPVLMAIALASCGGSGGRAGSENLQQDPVALDSWRNFEVTPAPPILTYTDYQTYDGSSWCVRISNGGTFQHAPYYASSGCDWNNSHLDTEAAYKTWDGNNWCMRITNGAFEHAPRPVVLDGCDWSQSHMDSVANIKNAAGANYQMILR